MKRKYSRYQFLKAVGFTGPALMAVLSSCTQNERFNVESLVLNSNGDTVSGLGSTTAVNVSTTPSNPTTPTTPAVNALVRVDLSSSAMSNLKNAGGYVIVNNTYVVGKLKNGDYVAASVVCTHEPKRQIILNGNEYYCTAHGARYNLSGQTLNTVARSSLSVYRTQVDGNILTVY